MFLYNCKILNVYLFVFCPFLMCEIKLFNDKALQTNRYFRNLTILQQFIT